jgi:hypothetical protein
MILILRGHIRNSFENKQLYNYIEKLYSLFPDLKIFIHTWNITSNNISWRKIDMNYNLVTEETIKNYLGELSKCIRHIIIDDDQQIKLIGNITGKINNGPMPIIGWKNYWYGKHKIISYIYTHIQCNNEMIINCRFDLFNNSNNTTETNIIQFINKYCNSTFTKNVFLSEKECWGIDNIYIGNIHTMYKLSNLFFFKLDDILIQNKNTIHQEFLVHRLNSTLF